MKNDNETRITFEIPLIFKIRLVKYGLMQGVFAINIGVFSSYIALCYGAGWSIGPVNGKWFCGLRIHLKRIIIGLNLGLDEIIVIDRRMKRLMKKLTLAQARQLSQILSDLLEGGKNG